MGWAGGLVPVACSHFVLGVLSDRLAMDIAVGDG